MVNSLWAIKRGNGGMSTQVGKMVNALGAPEWKNGKTGRGPRRGNVKRGRGAKSVKWRIWKPVGAPQW